jgi:hypothetical protein
MPKHMPEPSVQLCQVSEATIDAALSYWRGIARSPDIKLRVVGYTEITAIEREIDARRAHKLWRTGAFPGPSSFIVPADK